MDRAEKVVKIAKEMGTEIITLFAFSTENWSRPQTEVQKLFLYLKDYLAKNRETFNREKIRVNFIGRRDRLPEDLLKEIDAVECLTRIHADFILNVALDYGGRWDIVEATKKIIRDLHANNNNPDVISEEHIRERLSLSHVPYPDLLIRTSGEHRISNFLLWDLAYAELYFTRCLWPDFNKREFKKALNKYTKRERRYGSLTAQKE
jgi:undecaprenyl diphosphate synthase